MPPNLVLLVALIAGGVLLYRWLRTTAPPAARQQAKRIGIWVAIAVLVLLVATGRLNWLVALVGSLLVAAQRLAPLLRYAPLLGKVLGLAGGLQGARAAAGGRSAGGRDSQVETDYLKMTLDHGSGQVAGQVLRGRFAGRSLDQLSLRELLLLLAELRRSDPQAVPLLETYLDRTQGDQWRDADGGDQANDGARDGGMTKEEAFEILGLEPGASAAEIREAHRRLMQRLHPDRGGSGYLAAAINRAKDLLLG